MVKLLDSIESLKNSSVAEVVQSRINEFRIKGQSDPKEIFKELCFCILTANYTSEGGMRIQNTIDNDFLTLPEPRLASRLKQLGHRFPNSRARYIAAARVHTSQIIKLLATKNEPIIREWLVENVLGLGYKESSHFLRNIGYLNLAILDFHIIDVLVRHKVIRKPKTLSKKNYLGIEKKLEKISRATGLSQGELDFYLWYMETGKVLK